MHIMQNDIRDDAVCPVGGCICVDIELLKYGGFSVENVELRC